MTASPAPRPPPHPDRRRRAGRPQPDRGAAGAGPAQAGARGLRAGQHRPLLRGRLCGAQARLFRRGRAGGRVPEFPERPAHQSAAGRRPDRVRRHRRHRRARADAGRQAGHAGVRLRPQADLRQRDRAARGLRQRQDQVAERPGRQARGRDPAAVQHPADGAVPDAEGRRGRQGGHPPAGRPGHHAGRAQDRLGLGQHGHHVDDGAGPPGRLGRADLRRHHRGLVERVHGRRRARHRRADAGRHHPETPRNGASLRRRAGQGAGFHQRP